MTFLFDAYKGDKNARARGRLRGRIAHAVLLAGWPDFPKYNEASQAAARGTAENIADAVMEAIGMKPDRTRNPWAAGNRALGRRLRLAWQRITAWLGRMVDAI